MCCLFDVPMNGQVPVDTEAPDHLVERTTREIIEFASLIEKSA
jgi:hypothetical protein